MDLLTSIYEVVAAAAEPMLAAEVLRAVQPQTTPKLKPKDINTALAALVEGARIIGIKGLRKGSAGVCYTTRKPLDLASEALATVVSALPAAVSLTKLKALSSKPLRAWFDEALGRLIVQGGAYYLSKGKTRLVQSRPPKPSDILAGPALVTLQKVLEQANRLRRTSRTIAELLSWLDEETQEPIHIIPRPTAKRGVTAEQLRAWYMADVATASSSMIPIQATFARYQVWAKSVGEGAEVEVFKRAMKELYDSGEVMLEPHERPHELPTEQRELQVPMAFGPPGFYWGLLG